MKESLNLIKINCVRSPIIYIEIENLLILLSVFNLVTIV